MEIISAVQIQKRNSPSALHAHKPLWKKGIFFFGGLCNLKVSN
jgi:hypothetical protein